MSHLKNSFCFIEKEQGNDRVAIRKYGIPEAHRDYSPNDTISLVVREYEELDSLVEAQFAAANCSECRHRLLCLLNPIADVRFQPRSTEDEAAFRCTTAVRLSNK